MNCMRCGLRGLIVEMSGPIDAKLEQCRNGSIPAFRYECPKCQTVEIRPVTPPADQKAW